MLLIYNQRKLRESELPLILPFPIADTQAKACVTSEFMVARSARHRQAGTPVPLLKQSERSYPEVPDSITAAKPRSALATNARTRARSFLPR